MFREEKCLEFVFEGRERIRVCHILVEVVPDMKIEMGERAKAMSFATLPPVSIVAEVHNEAIDGWWIPLGPTT